MIPSRNPTNHTRGGAVCDSCLATPSFFFSLLRRPPLTKSHPKRTKREVLSGEFSSWGQPTALAFRPDCGSAMYMRGHLLYRSDCGCVQRTRVCSGRIEGDTASSSSSSCCCSGRGTLLNVFGHLLGPEATVCIKTKPNRLISRAAFSEALG